MLLLILMENCSCSNNISQVTVDVICKTLKRLSKIDGDEQTTRVFGDVDK